MKGTRMSGDDSKDDPNTHNDLNEIATVHCETTKGDIVMEFHRYWSPNGYDRAVGLFEAGFFDDSHFFRTVPGFLVQFGISYAGEDVSDMGEHPIPDDPQLDPRIPFTEGTISYAGSGPNSRTSQMFISLSKSGGNFGVELWETPVGQVIEGMEVVKQFYSGYGDMPPWGNGPIQGKIYTEGARYMEENFPKIDRFHTCHVERHAGGEHSRHQQQHHPQHPNDPHMRNIQHGAAASHRSSQKHAGRHHQQHPMLEKNEEHVTGQLHHNRGLHLNAAPDEEGLTKLSWELMSVSIILFVGVLALWLRFVLNNTTPKKSRKTS